MFDDDRPDEPDPPFTDVEPETEFQHGAEELGPDPPSPPEPHDPTASLPAENDVEGELLQSFWALVLMANVAVLGLAVGPMVLVFESDRQLGFGLIAVGLLAALVGARRYRQVEAATGDDATSGGADGDATPGGPDDDGADD